MEEKGGKEKEGSINASRPFKSGPPCPYLLRHLWPTATVIIVILVVKRGVSEVNWLEMYGRSRSSGAGVSRSSFTLFKLMHRGRSQSAKRPAAAIDAPKIEQFFYLPQIGMYINLRTPFQSSISY